MVSGPDWGSARAKLGTTREGCCSQRDPDGCLPRRAPVKASHNSQPYSNLTSSTQDPAEEEGAAAQGTQQPRRLELLLFSRKQEFPSEKASKTKSQAEAQGMAGIWLLPVWPSCGSKPPAFLHSNTW